MLIGILSDTHDRRQRTETAVRLLLDQGATMLFHCGDLVEPGMVTACASLPCHFVFGNNDARHIDEIQSMINQTEGAICLGWGGIAELAGKRIAMTHGHLSREQSRLREAQPDYLLLGHTHLTEDRREGTTRVINPGALHRAKTFTVGLLNLETDQLQIFPLPSDKA